MPAVKAQHRLELLRRRLPWLLWLALLLPLAQTAAAWHAYSHGRPAAEVRGVSDAAAPHAVACDLCIAAAAVGGGALRAEPPALALVRARHEAPRSVVPSVGPGRHTPAYLSRAPPSVPR
jgi:hypothetical protein